MGPLRSFLRNDIQTSDQSLVLLALLLMLPYGFTFQEGIDWHYYQVYAALWVFRDWATVHGDASAGFGFLDPLAFLSFLFVSCFLYLFAYQMVRHHRGQTSQTKVWISALLTLVPLGPVLILSLVGVALSAGGGVTGPIPLFLVVGLVIDHYWGVEPAIQPWETDEEMNLGQESISENDKVGAL